MRDADFDARPALSGLPDGGLFRSPSAGPMADAMADPDAGSGAGIDEAEVARLVEFLDRSRRLVVLTGAGCSTESGIPDYRDDSGRWKRRPPVTWQAFVADPHTRSRYWARSLRGWPTFARAHPNEAHRALARLQQRGGLTGVVTQNVDGLHQRAGSRDVIDLHGRLDQVQCLRCAARFTRSAVQLELERRNPAWCATDAVIAPDGDADLDVEDFAGFRVVDCGQCGGLLKPDVVFYGENVPRERVARVDHWLAQADAMLVVGSSLQVFSGFRLVRDAAARGLPVYAINRGATRADALLTRRLASRCAPLLQRAIP